MSARSPRTGRALLIAALILCLALAISTALQVRYHVGQGRGLDLTLIAADVLTYVPVATLLFLLVCVQQTGRPRLIVGAVCEAAVTLAAWWGSWQLSGATVSARWTLGALILAALFAATVAGGAVAGARRSRSMHHS